MPAFNPASVGLVAILPPFSNPNLAGSCATSFAFMSSIFLGAGGGGWAVGAGVEPFWSAVVRVPDEGLHAVSVMATQSVMNVVPVIA